MQRQRHQKTPSLTENTGRRMIKKTQQQYSATPEKDCRRTAGELTTEPTFYESEERRGKKN